ncbi:MAG TPA: secretin and TonB N-terminal domain-containing protein [Candidatus Aquabacterium excrementipullorum]|nr:secretin and TonB N-terminal domain-containing protein [Candidatus Aquabacterium excrementipullorum]
MIFRINSPSLLARAIVWSLAICLLAGCAAPELRQAQTLAQSGQHEAALAKLQQASEAHPDDTALRTAYIKQRDTTVAYLLYQAESARAAGRRGEVQSLLERLELAAPGHPRAAWLRDEIARADRQQRLLAEAKDALDKKRWGAADAALRAILAESPGHSEARWLQSQLDEQRADQTRKQGSLQLATAGKTITLEFREAALRSVFETLARAANVNFVFDKDVRGDAKVTLFLRSTTVDEALRVILGTQQLGSKLLNGNTVLVFPNTAQKQRELLDTVTRSFYLVNADPKQAQTLIRTVAKTRDIFLDERLNMLVVRDTPEVMRLVERLVAGIDLPDPEVMLELEVMEVSSNKLTEIGVSWPASANYGVPNSTADITSTSGLRWSAANPLAVATLRGSVDATNLLANPKIRARNREKAKILLGEKLPVFTTTSTANVGVSASVSYLDVGLKVELEPQVQLDNDVTIKVALEVSSVTGKVTGPEDSLAYQVGTRQATTSLRLKDGETQILAGLIREEETRTSAGLPWIHEMPVLGRLFGKTSDTRNKTEVVLLVTPHVVRNISQGLMSSLPMTSGTDAQPGAPAWVLSSGEAGGTAGRSGPGAPSRTPGLSARPMAGVPTEGVQLGGPDEVPPGGSFQITVTNPGREPLSAGLLYDLGVLSAATVPGGPPDNGRVQVDVPALGSKSFTFTAKAGAGVSETNVGLDNGAAAGWTIRIRGPQDAATPAPGEAPPVDPSQDGR